MQALKHFKDLYDYYLVLDRVDTVSVYVSRRVTSIFKVSE